MGAPISCIMYGSSVRYRHNPLAKWVNYMPPFGARNANYSAAARAGSTARLGLIEATASYRLQRANLRYIQLMTRTQNQRTGITHVLLNRLNCMIDENNGAASFVRSLVGIRHIRRSQCHSYDSSSFRYLACNSHVPSN